MKKRGRFEFLEDGFIAASPLLAIIIAALVAIPLAVIAIIKKVWRTIKKEDNSIGLNFSRHDD